jgi:hypothetical protein
MPTGCPCRTPALQRRAFFYAPNPDWCYRLFRGEELFMTRLEGPGRVLLQTLKRN